MNFIFETNVWMEGKKGRFEVYQIRRSKYFCKLMSWKAATEAAPGDVTLWKVNNEWKSNKSIDPHLKITLSTVINEYR